MIKTLTSSELIRAVDALRLNAHGTTPARVALAEEVYHIVYSGCDNANDTCLVEHAEPETEWERIALGSMAMLSTEPHVSNAARRWFAKRGIIG